MPTLPAAPATARLAPGPLPRARPSPAARSWKPAMRSMSANSRDKPCPGRPTGEDTGYSQSALSSGRVYPVAYMTELRSEEHMSELQSREKLVCRLLLEKKKAKKLY